MAPLSERRTRNNNQIPLVALSPQRLTYYANDVLYREGTGARKVTTLIDPLTGEQSSIILTKNKRTILAVQKPGGGKITSITEISSLTTIAECNRREESKLIAKKLKPKR